MKAYHHLTQAQLALGHPSEALSSALTAYDFCLQLGDPSLGIISTLVLKAKKGKWEVRERDRIRRRAGLYRELEDRLETSRREERRGIQALVDEGALDEVDAVEELGILDDVTRRKIEELQNVFAIADPEMAKRVRARG